LIDLHSHILAGVDDGARTLDESIAIARAAVASGVELMAATPHVRTDFPTTPDTMERLVEETQTALHAAHIELELRRGAEISLGFLPRLELDELRRFGLAGNPRYVLLEFPYEGWPLGLETTVASLREEGITAVLAHPERNESVQLSPSQLLPAVTAGALVQLTASSLTGTGGRSARRAADALLTLELAHLVAADLHAPGVRSGLDVAAEALGGGELARWLTHDVPSAIAHDRPLPPRPADGRSRRHRLGFLRGGRN
jgi:protein-tyrosine phosphatase